MVASMGSTKTAFSVQAQMRFETICLLCFQSILLGCAFSFPVFRWPHQ